MGKTRKIIFEVGDFMEDYKLYEVNLEKNRKRNEKYIKEFEGWLNEKNLVKKTIRKHYTTTFSLKYCIIYREE